MAEAKTRVNDASVANYIAAIQDPQRRADCVALDAMMRAATRAEPRMWGSAIIGYGTYSQRYANGKTADWPVAAFSPRKHDLTVYLVWEYDRHYPELMAKLGRHRCGKSCLYLKRLSDVHKPTLRKLITVSIKRTREINPPAKV